MNKVFSKPLQADKLKKLMQQMEII